MELPGRAAHAIRTCLCMFRRGRTFSKKQKGPQFDQNWSLFGLQFGPESPQKRSKSAPGGTEGGLACKMEGTGPFWDAKWRGRAPFQMQNGGSGSGRRARWRERRVAHWIRRARPSLSLACWIPIRKKSSKTFSRMGMWGALSPPL